MCIIPLPVRSHLLLLLLLLPQLRHQLRHQRQLLRQHPPQPLPEKFAENSVQHLMIVLQAKFVLFADLIGVLAREIVEIFVYKTETAMLEPVQIVALTTPVSTH